MTASSEGSSKAGIPPSIYFPSKTRPQPDLCPDLRGSPRPLQQGVCMLGQIPRDPQSPRSALLSQGNPVPTRFGVSPRGPGSVPGGDPRGGSLDPRPHIATGPRCPEIHGQPSTGPLDTRAPGCPEIHSLEEPGGFIGK
ncbi:unnamed protein product [Arctogadus glacialis]